jgi:hypothetical protein
LLKEKIMQVLAVDALAFIAQTTLIVLIVIQLRNPTSLALTVMIVLITMGIKDLITGFQGVNGTNQRNNTSKG